MAVLWRHGAAQFCGRKRTFGGVTYCPPPFCKPCRLSVLSGYILFEETSNQSLMGGS